MTTILPFLQETSVQERYSGEKDDRPPSPTLNEQKPPLGIPVDNVGGGLWGRLKRSYVDLDSIATQPSVFDDPITCEVYRPPPQYENTHKFDPDARWTWREEKV